MTRTWRCVRNSTLRVRATLSRRLGAALNLNVHIHALIVDGELAVLLGVIERRLVTLLARHGISDGRNGVDVSYLWQYQR